ncbi:HU family DNA-binding protein [Phocaeicola sp.]|uniref:HU family DNA-binding protein n=1 Tax=Phocaeicola sp. TaxID=2773926 RepID=UPI003AB1A7FD
MAIHYSVAAMKNPQDPEAPMKYYAKAQAAGVIEINELADEISYATTLTDGDVLNVIRALVKHLSKHIAKGEIVRLENLGSFQAQVCSKGADSEEAFTPSNITRVNLQFRPGVGLRGQLNLQNLQFRKVKSLKQEASTPGGGSGGGEDGGL